MDIKISEHYDGYEGEPEIQFIRCLSDGTKLTLSIWEGFFDRIMSEIKAGSDGWTDLAYYYHLHEGWYDESPWEIPDIGNTIEQLNSIEINALDKKTKNVFNDVHKLITNARIANEKVWIAYE